MSTTVPAHDFQAARFTGTVTCTRCGLLPLDSDDIDTPCTIPARIIARVLRDYTDDTGYPYYYTVDAYVPGDPEPAVIDYGSQPTLELARASIEWVLTHREECDNPEYVHTRALTRYAGPDPINERWVRHRIAMSSHNPTPGA